MCLQGVKAEGGAVKLEDMHSQLMAGVAGGTYMGQERLEAAAMAGGGSRGGPDVGEGSSEDEGPGSGGAEDGGTSAGRGRKRRLREDRRFGERWGYMRVWISEMGHPLPWKGTL